MGVQKPFNLESHGCVPTQTLTDQRHLWIRLRDISYRAVYIKKKKFSGTIDSSNF